MKNQILNSLMAAGFVALLGTTSVAAQPRQTATVPFTFEAGGRTYSDGTYNVERVGTTSNIRIVNIRNGQAAMVNVPVPTGTPGQGAGPKLVFRQSGERMSLGEVWFAGYPGMMTLKNAKDLSAKVVVGLK